MKVIKIVTISLVVFHLLGCPDRDDFRPDAVLLIKNKSSEKVVEYREYSNINDTVLQNSNPFTSIDFIESGTILPNGEIKIPEEKDRIAKSGSIHIYIINRDTLVEIPWERIREENIILRRYDLTLDNLELMDWTIEYP